MVSGLAPLALSAVRMFVAVWPPPAVVADIAAAVALLQDREPPELGLRWTTAEQWHVTLRFFGHVEPAAAAGALRSVAPVGGPVVVELGPATARFGRRVLHVPVRGLDALGAAVISATAGVGRPPEDRAFAGHVTVARARAAHGTDLSRLVGHPVSGRWEVAELALVASRPSRRGASYEIVERSPVQ